MSFKTCPACRASWETREELLADPSVRLAGYQADFEDLQAGLFLFTHSCHTTFALEVSDFADFREGPVFSERRVGKGDCPGYCLRGSELRACAAKCECAWVRDILAKLSSWPKKKARP